MDKAQYHKGYVFWWIHYPLHKKLDTILDVFLDGTFTDARDWLRQMRTARALSYRKMAMLMGITHSAYERLEKLEPEGRLTLEQLRRAAEALDCDLVYGFRPRSGKRPSAELFAKLAEEVGRHSQFAHTSAARKALTLAGMARAFYARPKRRKKRNSDAVVNE